MLAMDKLAYLYALAEEEEISVYPYSLPKNISGLLVCTDNVKGIAINKNIRSLREEKCVLAEELGHYFTSLCDLRLYQKKDYLKSIDIRKEERKARKWAVEKLITVKDFVEAFKAGCHNKFEVAEFLDVTDDFLDQAIEIYNAKYGKCIIVDNTWIVSFDPFGVNKIDL